jgi:hypothetical protein
MQHISNYRATALSNASSPIFELVFKPYLKNEDPCDMYHCGFAPQLSTCVCTTTFKLCIECYTQHRSHIFALYISQKHSTLLFIRNDTRQGSILSPHLFSRYNRHLIFDVR